MKLQEFQSSKCSYSANLPFSICWSNDDLVAMGTEKGVYVTGGVKNLTAAALWWMLLVGLISHVTAGDMTPSVFGDGIPGLPAAFGDFDSDEYPDIFIIKYSQKGIEIILGADTEPFMRRNKNLNCDFHELVTSIVPGDFNGDAYMDVLITFRSEDPLLTTLKILKGNAQGTLNCESREDYPNFRGQPLAMDYNQDMIIDLFGEDKNGSRVFWVFTKSNSFNFTVVPMVKDDNVNRHFDALRIPHSHAFLDLNDDSAADLFVTTNSGFEVWLWEKGKNFVFYTENRIPWPDKNIKHVGQSLMMDIELKGKIDHILPVCFSSDCRNSSIYVYSHEKWHNLNTIFHDKNGFMWGFVPQSDTLYLEAPTLHGGDFNMDGYPDILVTLQTNNKRKSCLLKNVPCTINCLEFSRTFEVDWDILEPHNNNTILGVFYDFMQDGILDIIFVHDGPFYNVTAFKNSLDYDANFVKVMVITGLKDRKQPVIPGPLGRRNRTYGTNLPGPKIAYQTMTQEGSSRAAVAAQLPQSAYFALHLPYTLFGLGRTPNFVDNLLVGVSGYNRTWRQVIPNSQMVVIPLPKDKPEEWTARLFVTPSKLIAQSFIALLATCVFISVIIGILYWKERREDNYEKFHFLH